MKVSEFIIAMKDFQEEITYGQIEELANKPRLLRLCEEQFKEVARVFNDAEALRRKKENNATS